MSFIIFSDYLFELRVDVFDEVFFALENSN